jgi:hypothetical protein
VENSDDEGSVVAELTRSDKSCGACRTRESETWWKAPKALSLATNVLCDNCGISWRKYADLNVRPYREEVISKNKPPGEKREGTPLAAPVSKRPRVSTTPRPSFCPPNESYVIDVGLDCNSSSYCFTSSAMFSMSQDGPSFQDSSMSSMSIPCASWSVSLQYIL